MAETFQQTLTRQQLDNGVIPSNTVLVEMTYTTEGIRSKGGIIIGFNRDVEYDDESDSHAANLAEIYATVYKCPPKLYYKRGDNLSMPWDVDMELQVGDRVWFNGLESSNAVEVVCEGTTYKLIPYQDIYCAKRSTMENLRDFFCDLVVFNEGTLKREEVIMPNGYVLLERVFLENKSKLAVSKQGEVDKTRGIIRFIGRPPKEYQRKEYCDIKDLEVGDMVLLAPNAPLFLLERTTALSTFDGDNLYWVTQRRRISMVLSKNN